MGGGIGVIVVIVAIVCIKIQYDKKEYVGGLGNVKREIF